MGAQTEIDQYFAELTYSLRYAGITTFSDGSPFPARIDHTNVKAVAERFNQLLDEAAKLIKANAVRFIKEGSGEEEEKKEIDGKAEKR